MQQGDPLAVLLWAVDSRTITDKLKSLLPELKLNIWIHDDCTLIGSLDSLKKPYDIVLEEGSKIGLKLSPSKSLIWNSLPVSDDNPLQRQIPRAPSDGFILLGTPMGTPSFSRQVLAKRIAKIKEATVKLPTLNDSHVEFILLRSCLAMPKINFSLRTCKPTDVASSYEAFDGLLRDSLNALLGTQVDDFQWMQASSPVSMGGLGLRNALPQAAGSYLVSLAHASSFAGSNITDPGDDCLQMLSSNVSPTSAFTFEDLKSKPQIHVTHEIDLRI